MNTHEVDEYLRHIVEAIERIESYTAGLTKKQFVASSLVQDAVVRNIEIVGEASHRVEVLFPNFVNQHSDLPFGIAYQMRNSVAHGYFGVDLAVVWNTVINDLPPFAE